MSDALLSEMLRYWRTRLGLSQEQLALNAGVSSRHLNFLETGKSRPSEGMLLRLLEALEVPLTSRNAALDVAGFPSRFEVRQSPNPLGSIVDHMMAQHEPFPLTVLAADGTIVHANSAATNVFSAFVLQPAALPDPLDMFSLVFDPRLMRPFVRAWETLAQGMLARARRELLERDDASLRARIERVFAYPDVPARWRQLDVSSSLEPAITVRLERDAAVVSFLVTVTAFAVAAPNDRLRIESCYPLDAATRAFCEALAAESGEHARAVVSASGQ